MTGFVIDVGANLVFARFRRNAIQNRAITRIAPTSSIKFGGYLTTGIMGIEHSERHHEI